MNLLPKDLQDCVKGFRATRKSLLRGFMDNTKEWSRNYPSFSFFQYNVNAEVSISFTVKNGDFMDARVLSGSALLGSLVKVVGVKFHATMCNFLESKNIDLDKII
jgi:hypothetical protein